MFKAVYFKVILSFFVIFLPVLYFFSSTEVFSACSSCYGGNIAKCSGSCNSCHPECNTDLGYVEDASGSEAKCCDTDCTCLASGFKAACNDCCGCTNTKNCKLQCPNNCPCTATSKSSPWIKGTAPSGWIGDCKARTSCQESKTDCSTCRDDQDWYLPDTNNTPSQPTALSLNFNTLNLNLSTVEAIPTLVMNPRGEAVTMTMPSYSQDGARAIKYAFRADNWGLGGDWDGYTESPVRPEDIIKEVDTNTTSFNPALGADPVLDWAHKGKIWVHNMTLDKCKDSWRFSTGRTGYYLVNTLPVVDKIEKLSQPETITDPNHVSNTCTTSEYSGRDINNPIRYAVEFFDPNRLTYQDVEALYVWFSNKTETSDGPPTITHILTSGTNDGITPNAFGFMVRKEGSTWNSVPDASNRIGNVEGNWNNIYVASNNSGTWSMIKANDGIIRGPGGRRSALLSDISVTSVGANVRLEFSIKFLDERTLNAYMINDGEYSIYAGASDHFSMLPFGGTALRRQPVWADKNTKWKIDLRKPEVQVITPPTVVSSRVMEFSVTTNDGFSQVKRVIGDAIRTGQPIEGKNTPITRYLSNQLANGTFTPFTLVQPTQPNYYRGDPLDPVAYNSVDWDERQLAYQQYNSSDNLWITGYRRHNIRLDIQGNEGGGFAFYATAFDNACNYSSPLQQNYPDIGSPWLMTKAGMFYSKGATDILVKKLSPATEGRIGYLDKYDFSTVTSYSIASQETIFDQYNDKYSFLRTQTQLGTEFLSTGSIAINNIIQPDATNMFRTLSYVDRVGEQEDGWFQYFKERYELASIIYPERYHVLENEAQQEAFIKAANVKGSTTLMSSQSANKAVVMVHDGDLTLGSRLVCNVKTLILVDGDLTLNPDITRFDPSSASTKKPAAMDGCIFIASGNIIVEAGDRVSNSLTPAYDLIEGILLAENQIIFPEVDIDPDSSADSIARDGIKIHGGIYAFGMTDTPGIVMERSLKLADNIGYPALVVHHDPRYMEVIKHFFGGLNYTFVREPGQKPEHIR